MSAGFKKIIQFSFIGANIIVIVFYLLACLVPYINSGRSWFIAILGLGFPLLFFVLTGFLIYWLVQRSKWVFACITALLLSWKQVSVMFSFHLPAAFKATKPAQTLRVLTWNLSSWGESNRTGVGKNDYEDEMINVIKKSNADVLCLQEYLYYKDSKYRDSIIPALKESGYRYCYFVRTNYTYRLYKTTTFTAMAIISKLPFTDTAHFFYNDDDFAEPIIYADIRISDQNVRIFTTHLQSVKFSHYHFNILHEDPARITVPEPDAITARLRNAYNKRAGQAEMLDKKIKGCPYPVVVCGDFNDVPNSYTYFTIKGDLQDAFLRKGSGLGRTFRFISPTLRIDYILADKKLEVAQFGKIEVPYSDHYPIVADIDLLKNQ